MFKLVSGFIHTSTDHSRFKGHSIQHLFLGIRHLFSGKLEMWLEKFVCSFRGCRLEVSRQKCTTETSINFNQLQNQCANHRSFSKTWLKTVIPRELQSLNNSMIKKLCIYTYFGKSMTDILTFFKTAVTKYFSRQKM